MHPNNPHFKKKEIICLYGLLFISALLPALLAVKNIRISPDSMIYALVSQEIRAGNGISLPIIYNLEDNYNLVNGAVPYVGGPPLLPVLFALSGGIAPQSYLAAQMINVISHVMISILTFLIMNTLCNNKGISLLAGILVPLSFPMIWNTHFIITESLYIALAAAAVFFLTLSRRPYRDKLNRNLFYAGIFISAAILTRFAGVALMPGFFWGIFVLAKNKKIGGSYAVLATLLPLIAAGALFMRTYMISGSIHGIILPSPERSYIEALAGTIKMIFLLFDLRERHITLFLLLAALLIPYIVFNSNARREVTKYISSGLDVIIIFIISHTVLVTHAMAKSQEVFEVRYMSLLVPFLFIFCFLIIVIVWESIRRKGFPRLALCVLVLSIGIITFSNCYKTYMHSGELFNKQPGHYRFLKSQTYAWIKQNYRDNEVITTNRPFHLSFFGGYTTIRLPHRRFNRNYVIPDDMESFLPNRMSHFGSRVLAIFEQADEENEGSYIAGLFNGEDDDDNFVLIRKFPDGVVYNLKNNISGSLK